MTKDAYFIVLCPGEKDDIAAIQRGTGFTRYPFVDPEQVMMLGTELKLMMSEHQLWPAIMEVDELVDAALTGYDQGEVVTIPSLTDNEDWERYESARQRLAPHLSRDHAADRYKSDIPEDA